MNLQKLLSEWSELLRAAGIAKADPQQPPATPEDIQKAEDRLGLRLPSSYKEFLQTTNGWAVCDEPAVGPGHLFCTSEIRPFAADHSDWIDAFSLGPPVTEDEHRRYGQQQDCVVFRSERLRQCIQISAVGDGGGAVALLCPEVQTANGEWEGWYFANWIPGAYRFVSFRRLLEHLVESATELDDED